MKIIQLTQGKVAFVDDADYESLSKFKWYAQRDRKTHYALRKERSKSKRITVRMHVQLFGGRCDHRDRNGLNNRRENLRAATLSQQNASQSVRRDNHSGYKGVIWHQAGRKWRAGIHVNGKSIHLGLFTRKEAAALAYDAAAKKHFGKEFAVLNAPWIRWNETGVWDLHDE